MLITVYLLLYRAIEFDVNNDLKIWNIDDDGFTSETCLKKLKRTVATLYQLCFGLSQKSNFLQEDNGLFFALLQSFADWHWNLASFRHKLFKQSSK